MTKTAPKPLFSADLAFAEWPAQRARRDAGKKPWKRFKRWSRKGLAAAIEKHGKGNVALIAYVATGAARKEPPADAPTFEECQRMAPERLIEVILEKGAPARVLLHGHHHDGPLGKTAKAFGFSTKDKVWTEKERRKRATEKKKGHKNPSSKKAADARTGGPGMGWAGRPVSDDPQDQNWMHKRREQDDAFRREQGDSSVHLTAAQFKARLANDAAWFKKNGFRCMTCEQDVYGTPVAEHDEVVVARDPVRRKVTYQSVRYPNLICDDCNKGAIPQVWGDRAGRKGLGLRTEGEGALEEGETAIKADVDHTVSIFCPTSWDE